MEEYTASADVPGAIARAQKLMAHGEGYFLLRRVRRKDNTYLWTTGFANRVLRSQGRYELVITFIRIAPPPGDPAEPRIWTLT